jgi:hypothetical protein
MTGDTKAKGVGAQVETLIRAESMTDLVEKLRDMALDADEGAAFDHQDAALLTEAADELSRLRSQVEEMRGALEAIRDQPFATKEASCSHCAVRLMRETAAQALKGQSHD